jgi:hypothetical protein
MNERDFVEDIAALADVLGIEGFRASIDRKFGTVEARRVDSSGNEEDLYFAQGEDAFTLIDEADAFFASLTGDYDITEEDYLLWHLDGAGAFDRVSRKVFPLRR